MIKCEYKVEYSGYAQKKAQRDLFNNYGDNFIHCISSKMQLSYKQYSLKKKVPGPRERRERVNKGNKRERLK